MTARVHTMMNGKTKCLAPRKFLFFFFSLLSFSFTVDARVSHARTACAGHTDVVRLQPARKFGSGSRPEPSGNQIVTAERLWLCVCVCQSK